MNLVESCGLAQHVKLPSHHSGHTLDMILTWQEQPPSAIKVIDIHDKLDHYAVSFTLQTAKPPLPRKEITHWSYKAIDIEAFSLDIQ